MYDSTAKIFLVGFFFFPMTENTSPVEQFSFPLLEPSCHLQKAKRKEKSQNIDPDTEGRVLEAQLVGRTWANRAHLRH